MKKVAVMILGFSLLMLLTVLPVVAESPKKLAVALSTSNVKTDHSEAKIMETSSGVHIWGAVRTGNVKLTIGSGDTAQIFTGSVRVDVDYINWTGGGTLQHYHKFVLTFPVQTGLSEVGVFEGVNTWTAFPFDTHYTLQGSGGFKGYTLHIDRDPEKGVVAWVLIH